MQPPNNVVIRQLFGGAMEIQLPDRLADVSDFRPVPDNQEVFADADLDQSLIVEVLERLEVGDAGCAKAIFDDLALQQAQGSAVESLRVLEPGEMPFVPAHAYKELVEGTQMISKGRQGTEAANQVHVMLCVVRLQAEASEVVLTLNTPMYISEASAAAEHAGAGPKGAHLMAPQLFAQLLASFTIKDYGLFG